MAVADTDNVALMGTDSGAAADTDSAAIEGIDRRPVRTVGNRAAEADCPPDGEGRLSPLSTPGATRLVLEAHGIGTKYTLGQNFLVNDDVLRKIVRLADLCSSDRLLEVGPGIGTLTIALLKCAESVVAVERDPDLPAVLADTLAPWRDKFALIEKDALDLAAEDILTASESFVGQGPCPCRTRDDAPEADGKGMAFALQGHSDLVDPLSHELVPNLPYAVAAAAEPQGDYQQRFPNKLVANLPYAVAATVVLDYFQRFPFLDSATVMVQKEVADRMAAKVGTKNYGAYTVKLGLVAEPTGRFAVGPGNFFPPPRVDSAVIRLDRRAPAFADGTPASPEVVAAASLMADAAFANRRKTLANSCKTYFAGRGAIALPTSVPQAGASASATPPAPSPALVLDGASIVAQLPALFEAAAIDPRRRGETLDQREFLALGRALLALLPS